MKNMDQAELGRKPIALTEQQLKWLLYTLSRNLRYQSPTPVQDATGKLLRINLAMFPEDYEKLMILLELDDRFRLSSEDHLCLTHQFAERAKTASGSYDVTSWSMGELQSAREDTEGLAELADFRAAILAEIAKRTAD